MKLFSAAAAAALLACTAMPFKAETQTPAALPTSIDEKALVGEIVRQVREIYVVPERRAAIVSRLEQALAAGRYAIEEPRVLTERISEDMRASSNDGHMYLLFDPQRANAMLSRPQGPQPGADAVWTSRALRSNHGVGELKILDGNVRYLNLSMFHWVDDGRSKQALDDAMRFLAGGDAIIIDIRATPGGNPDAVNYVTSHFVAPGTHLMDFHNRGTVTPSHAQAGDLPAGRLTNKPLYVLTSRRTGSAAEEFAYHVANFKLGELVGEATAGAAHNNANLAVGQGFIASISAGRPVHPVTGGNWEAKGVAPTLQTAPESALEMAHLKAVEKLASAPGPEQARATFLAQSLRAKISPAVLAAPPEAYVGRFGPRAIRVENGGLIYQRDGAAKSRLLPIGGDRFAVEADLAAHIQVRLQGGRAASIEVLRDDGSRTSTARTADS